jgi:hypothetical protein
MEPKGSLLCSQEPSTGPNSEPGRASPYHPSPIFLRYIFILPTHLCLGLPSGLFPSGFPTNILYDPLQNFFHHYPERTCRIHTSDIPSTKSHIHFLSLRSFMQGICPCPRLLTNSCNELIFLWWGLVSPTPNRQAGGPPLVGCLRLHIQYIRSYLPYLQLEDTPCRGDREPT